MREEESEEESEQESEEESIINTSKSFKSDECVICLTEPPNVLFCNCGHLHLCAECSKIECFEECPICKTAKNNFKNYRIKYFFFIFPRKIFYNVLMLGHLFDPPVYTFYHL